MPLKEANIHGVGSQTSIADAKEFSIVGIDAGLGIPLNPVGQVCKPQPPCTAPPCRGCKPPCRHNTEGE